MQYACVQGAHKVQVPKLAIPCMPRNSFPETAAQYMTISQKDNCDWFALERSRAFHGPVPCLRHVAWHDNLSWRHLNPSERKLPKNWSLGCSRALQSPFPILVVSASNFPNVFVTWLKRSLFNMLGTSKEGSRRLGVVICCLDNLRLPSNIRTLVHQCPGGHTIYAPVFRNRKANPNMDVFICHKSLTSRQIHWGDVDSTGQTVRYGTILRPGCGGEVAGCTGARSWGLGGDKGAVGKVGKEQFE